MSTAAVTPQPTLAQAVRAKYPGVYDDLDDATLEQKVLAKYPQYADMPRTAPNAGLSTGSELPIPTQLRKLAPGQGEISNQPTGALPWLKAAEGDVRYGTGQTFFGKLLQKAGATGVGDSGVANSIASPVLGPLKAAQGAAEIPTQPGQGLKDILGGALQTATLPAAFMAPEAAEAAIGTIPSEKYAGNLFQQVMGAAKNQAIPITDKLSEALSRYQDLVDNGGQQSLAVRKLLQRVTNPNAEPLNYQDARDFYSNISRLSADETNRLTPVMKQQIGAIRVALNDAVAQGAGQVGKQGEYLDAMQNFRQAKKLKNIRDNVTGYIGDELKDKLPWLGLGYAAKRILSDKPK